MRNIVTSASIWPQIRDTVDFEIPESQPNAFTKSSTFRVEVPVMYAVMMTAHNALSIRRRVTEQVMLMISQAVFKDHDPKALRPDELIAIGDPETLAELRDPIENLMRVAHEATNRWRTSIKDMTFDEVVAYGTRVHGELMLLLASITEQQYEDTIIALTNKSIGELLARHGEHGREHWGFAMEGIAARAHETATTAG